MKYAYNIKLWLPLCFLLSSCGGSVEDFVKGARRDPASAIGTGVNSPMSFKVTAGKLDGTASDMALKGTVTTTDKKFQLGTDMAVQLTLSRTRVNPL